MLDDFTCHTFDTSSHTLRCHQTLLGGKSTEIPYKQRCVAGKTHVSLEDVQLRSLIPRGYSPLMYEANMDRPLDLILG